MDTILYVCIGFLLFMGIAFHMQFLVVLAIIFALLFAASKGLLGAVRSSEAGKPLQERVGTVLQRTQTLYKQQHYEVQFEDNGEKLNLMAHDGEGPMHLQPGDYGLLSVRGHTLYGFKPRQKGITDEAVTINANTLFADQVTDWVDFDDGNN